MHPAINLMWCNLSVTDLFSAKLVPLSPAPTLDRVDARDRRTSFEKVTNIRERFDNYSFGSVGVQCALVHCPPQVIVQGFSF